MRRALAILLVLLGAAACSSSSSHKTTPTTLPPVHDLRGQKQVEVEADNNLFTPASIIISQGTTVTWKNTDTEAHNVTSDTGAGFGVRSGQFGPGASYSYKFTKAGVYPYTCTIHTDMNGLVRVETGSSVTSSTAVG
jgi:plastocyanin